MIHCGELLPNILQLFIEKAASSQIASEIHILKFELLEHFVAGIPSSRLYILMHLTVDAVGLG